MRPEDCDGDGTGLGRGRGAGSVGFTCESTGKRTRTWTRQILRKVGLPRQWGKLFVATNRRRHPSRTRPGCPRRPVTSVYLSAWCSTSSPIPPRESTWNLPGIPESWTGNTVKSPGLSNDRGVEVCPRNPGIHRSLTCLTHFLTSLLHSTSYKLIGISSGVLRNVPPLSWSPLVDQLGESTTTSVVLRKRQTHRLPGGAEDTKNRVQGKDPEKETVLNPPREGSDLSGPRPARGTFVNDTTHRSLAGDWEGTGVKKVDTLLSDGSRHGSSVPPPS